jgi:hypothetical protein
VVVAAVTYITCEAIEGPCCTSCHEDYALGWDGGGYDEMCMIYDEDAPLTANSVGHVCCLKADAALALYRARKVAGTT